MSEMLTEKLEAYYSRLAGLRNAEVEIRVNLLHLYAEMEAEGIQCSLCARFVKLPYRGASYCPYGSFKPDCYPKCFVSYEYELITDRMEKMLAEYAERKQTEAEATKQVVNLVRKIQVTASKIERQLGVDNETK